MSNMVDAVAALNYEVSRLFNVEEELIKTRKMLSAAQSTRHAVKADNTELKREVRVLEQVERRYDALIAILESTNAAESFIKG